jgi:ATP-binding cassette, subfamily B, bacterial
MTGGLRLFRRLLGDARPYWPHIAGLLVLSALSSLFMLLTPVPLKIAVDSVVGDHPMPGWLAALVPDSASNSKTGTLIVASLLFLMIALLKQLQSFCQLWLTTYTGQRLLLGTRSQLFRHAQDLSLGFHDKRGSSDSGYRIQYDAESVQNVAVVGLIPFVTAALTVGGMIYVTARIDWQLALVSLAIVPILFFTFRLYRARLRGQWHDAKRLESSALSVVYESLESLRVVKAFGQEDREQRRFTERSGKSVDARLGLAVAEGWFGLAIALIIGSAMAAILFLGTSRVLAGTLTLGNLTLVMGYLQQLYDPLKTASKKAGDLQASLASIERVYELLDQTPEVQEPRRPRSLSRARGDVAFERVSFAYEPDRLVLGDVNLSVPAGSRVGISGETGAGKTTLVGLLTRLYDATSGTIRLDGVDVREYRIEDLRRQYAIVLQEPVLFSASIAENIAYARPEATRSKIEEAARAANAHDFIVRLPEGYATQVGARGMRLSGGERQRVTLARAFLKDAPILILDEPTSSVDTRTEAVIADAMGRLMAGRTTFIIAHRLTTLEGCDMRVEVEAGELTVIGSGAPSRPFAARTATPPATREEGGEKAPAGEPLPLSRLRDGRAFRALPDQSQATASSAWRRLGAGTAPSDVETLRAKGATVVYRLHGAGDAGAPVIAKRAPRANARLERSLHEEVLPWLPIPHLRLYGYLGDEIPDFGWIFMEDPGGTSCAGADGMRALGRWLGHLHAGAERLDAGDLFGSPGDNHLEARYADAIRLAKRRLDGGLHNPSVREPDRSLILSLVSLCTLAERRLPELCRICASARPTLVHGDPSSDYLRLAAGGIYALDWEFSGWGPPAPDLYVLDRDPVALASYCEALAEHGEREVEGSVTTLAQLGCGLRLLRSVEWASPYLETPWPEAGVARLRTYEAPLRAWLEDRVAA